nr:hypothetical protein RVX_1367 [Nitratidesulfovibrio sp. HK-II]
MTLLLLSARRQLRAIRFSQHPVTQQKNCRAKGETGGKAPLCPALRHAHTHIMPGRTHIAATPWPFTAVTQYCARASRRPQEMMRRREFRMHEDTDDERRGDAAMRQEGWMA